MEECAASEIVCSKEEIMAGRKRKQAVRDELLTPCTKKSSLTELDAKIASYIYENGIALNTAA